MRDKEEFYEMKEEFHPHKFNSGIVTKFFQLRQKIIHLGKRKRLYFFLFPTLMCSILLLITKGTSSPNS